MNNKTIFIIGLGLIGGSLALALKEKTQYRVSGYDLNSEMLQQALRMGALDDVAQNAQSGAATADIIVLCLPVCQIPPTVLAMRDQLKEGAIITDVGSTKNYLGQVLPEMLPQTATYIGGHPMAGSECSGFSAARASLFENRPYLLIPAKTGEYCSALTEMEKVVKEIGGVPITINSEIHDAITAKISHLPHIMASCLVTLALNDENADFAAKLAAGGFKDTTRIASSNPEMWSDICLTNRDNILACFTEMQTMMQEFSLWLEQQDKQAITGFFSNARKLRGQFVR